MQSTALAVADTEAMLRTSDPGGYTFAMSKRGLDIASLTPEERLDLLEELWDSLGAASEAIPLTGVQRAELDRRLDDLEREGPAGIPLDEVLGRIRDQERLEGGAWLTDQP
jgi:putative addiction module component (TIGR02574 family)